MLVQWFISHWYLVFAAFHVINCRICRIFLLYCKKIEARIQDARSKENVSFKIPTFTHLLNWKRKTESKKFLEIPKNTDVLKAGSKNFFQNTYKYHPVLMIELSE